MRAIIARIAAIIAGGLVTYLAGRLGVDVTEGARTSLESGITAIGLAIWMVVYASGHKLINKFIDPNDAAVGGGDRP